MNAISKTTDMAAPAVSEPTPAVSPAPRRPLMRRLRPLLLILGPLALLIGGAYFYVSGARYVSTDNAYVKADIAAISAEISGKVEAVAVADNDHVTAGQLLFQVDPQPFRLALAQAEAQLKTTRDGILAKEASYRQKQSEIVMAQENIAFYEQELGIYEKMAKSQIAAQTQLDEARHNLTTSRQELPALQQELAAILAELGGQADAPPEQHARYLAAQAARDQAALDLQRTEIHAPANGIITNLTLRPGDYIKTGTPIFSLVETDHLWVEANFKETDLTHVRPGQTASVEIDTYPGTTWTTTVGSISAATGAEFALLPPQNSSGNWVKVVQRIPVRLEIADRPGQPPLRAGMSAVIEIDTGYHRILPSPIGSALAWMGVDQ
jgi:membrane fusion protein (multidrug efflux system)